MPESKVDIILNSAEELMCQMQEPNAEITVEMIAKNAGIGKGSIYYYFESKEDIIDAVIERSYTKALKEFFGTLNKLENTFDKLKLLFTSIVRKDFADSSTNIIRALHVKEDVTLHHKMMMTAIKTVSPILEELLIEGTKNGLFHAAAPKESAEMIVAMLTFLLDNSFFPSDMESKYRKLKLYAQVLENSLKTEPESLDFLFDSVEI